ncbi:MAG TPA: alanyl-tRNA editing protein [Chloroflexia bacterium]|nr:alanyl-tRNA editing protein [Chloroflexia bacterium]
MTEKLYYKDTYAKEFEAEIVSLDQEGNLIALDRSAFYPGGGGQPCDLGWLTIEGEQYTITEVFANGNLIWHRLDRAIPADFKGRGVQALLDWERRYSHMRHHTALHVLNGVAYNNFGALVTGGQVYADRARIDLTMEDLAPDKVELIERQSNEAIQKALPLLPQELTQAEAAAIPELVRTLNVMPPQSEKMRIVEISGLDRQFCGGTHLGSTLEVGQLKIAGTRSKGKQNKRIEIVLE